MCCIRKFTVCPKALGVSMRKFTVCPKALGVSMRKFTVYPRGPLRVVCVVYVNLRCILGGLLLLLFKNHPNIFWLGFITNSITKIAFFWPPQGGTISHRVMPCLTLVLLLHLPRLLLVYVNLRCVLRPWACPCVNLRCVLRPWACPCVNLRCILGGP